ncbi:MAG: DUF4476 domain-containing protein [Vicingus serpentipes]|nr:DUF4476 domain-containing protein [Vicingus serpentipes]
MLKVRSILFKASSFTLLYLLSFNSIAQSTNTIFKGKTPFKVSINNTLQHQKYTNNLNISLYGEQYYNIKIEFENDTTILQKNIYIIDNGLAYFFEVTLKDFKLKKITPNQLLEKEENLLAITYTGKKLIVENMLADTLQEDTTYTPPFDSYYELEDYNGIITCPWPIKPEELAELKGILNSQPIDDSKFEKIKERVLDSDSLCIMVSQVAELIPLFQYEDTKLIFAKFILPSIFDMDNIGKLETVFEFENSVDELKEIAKKIKSSIE